MADRRSIEVSGLPSFLSDEDFIKDQLLLHFLRPNNGGGDVNVHYPTEEKGAALLVFEDEKVAERILSRTHNLIIGDYIYPLEVRRPQPRESMFSGPVRTSLVLSHFSNFREVKKLLEQHRLRIYQDDCSILGIEGDFSDLKRCDQDLNMILCRQNPMEKHNSMESPASKRSASEKGRRAPDSVTTVPELKLPLLSHLSRRPPKERDHMTQDRRPPKEREHMTQERRPPKEGQHVTQDRSPKEGKNMAKDNITRDNLSPTQHSPTNQSAQKSSTKPARSSTPTRFQNVLSPQGLSQSFLVDPVVHTYVRIFVKEIIHSLLRQYNIDMTYKYSDGFTSITLTSLTPAQPEDFDKSCSVLKKFFDHYQNHLRAQNITLPTDPRIPNEEMTRKIELYLLKRDIYSLPVDNNTLSIIGPSEKVLMFMQEWIGARGQLVQNIIGEAAGSFSSRSPTVGLDKKDLATNSSNSTKHMVQDRRPPKEREHLAQDRRPPKEGDHMTKDRRPPKEGEDMTQDRRPPKEGEDMTQDRRPPKEGEDMTQDRRPPKEGEHMAQDRRPPKEEEDMAQDRRPPKEREHMPQDRRLPKEGEHMTQDRRPTKEGEDMALHRKELKEGEHIGQERRPLKEGEHMTQDRRLPKEGEDMAQNRRPPKEREHMTQDRRLHKEGEDMTQDRRPPKEGEHMAQDRRPPKEEDNTQDRRPPKEGQHVTQDRRPPKEREHITQDRRPPKEGEHMTQDRRPPKEGVHMAQDRRPPKEGEDTAQNRRPPKEREHMTQDRRPSKEGEHMTQDRRPTKEGEHMTQDRNPTKEGQHLTQDRRPPKEGEDMTQENMTRDNLSPTQHSCTNQGAQKSSTKPARSSTPTRFQNIPSPLGLSQSFLVDPAVHTYLKRFEQERISNFLREYKIDMKEKYSDGFTSITLTSLTPAQPEDFDKTCSLLKEFFDRYQNHLRAENITLPTDPRIPNEEMTRKIQLYLLKCDIYSLPKDDNTLSIIGPSEKVLMFMQKWIGARGQLVQYIIGEAAGSVSSRSPMVGLDKDLATNSNNSTKHMVQDGRPPKERENLAQDRRPPIEGDHMTQDRRPPKEGEDTTQDRKPPKEGQHLTQDRRPPKEGEDMTQDRRPPKGGEDMTQDRRPPKEGEDMTQDNMTRDNLSPTQSSCTNQGAQKSSTKPARSSTPTQFQNIPSPPGLFQSFLVDPAVHTYLKRFEQETISNFLRQYKIDMKEKYSDGFTSITLTSLTPAQPEDFDKTCSLLKEFFDRYQNHIRAENITLPTDPRIPNEEMTRKIQLYLLKCDIYSLPKDDNRLSIIGPSEKVLKFMQEWIGARGQLVQYIIGEAAGSVSSRSPMVGLDKDLATNSNNSTKHMVQDGRPPKERENLAQDRRPPIEGDHMTQDRRPPKEGEDTTQDRKPPKEGQHLTQDRRPPKEGEDMTQDRRPPKGGEDMTQDRRPPKEGEDMTQDNMTRDNLSPTQSSCTNQGAQKSSTKPARSSTPTQFQNIPSPPGLFQSFLVDPAVHTYLKRFEQETISNFLRQYKIDMKEKYSDGFTSITLTSLTPAQPEDFDKTCSLLKEFFDRYQNHIRAENITLPTDPRIPNEEMTRKIQLYLLKCDIYSLPKDDNRLSIIGPSEKVLKFMQEWIGARGQLVQYIIGEAAGSVSSRSPMVGLDKDLATNSNNSTKHMVQDGRPPKERENLAQDRRPPIEGDHMTQDRRPPKEGEDTTQDRKPPKEGQHLTQDRRPPKEGEDMTQDRRPPKGGEDMTQDRRPPKEGEDMTQDNMTRDNLSPTQSSCTNQGAQKSSTKPARSSTPTQFQNIPSPPGLFQSFLVGPAVHTYLKRFEQETISNFLRQYKIDMKEKYSDGFTSITLTSLTPAQPEDFDKTCSLLKEFFDRYQNHLRAENITLPTDPRIPNEEMTRKIQLYLLKCDIYSLPKDDNTLSIIGPSEKVLMFMQEWIGARGQLVQYIIGEAAGSVSSRSSMVGMDNKATKSNNSTQPMASDGRARGRQGRQEAHDRGRDREHGGPSSFRGKSPARHTREPWR
ncbi:uncharacterized protein LOC130272831 [Hyla sarda]|uniref:uncharacterized protein LOC130272831 n=1 Tax=Hyla sarda TaxID=327740 RepID=UPI0024C2CA9E|nr:uncharacterized protein LOC130272831 [Hyla sarda]